MEDAHPPPVETHGEGGALELQQGGPALGEGRVLKRHTAEGATPRAGLRACPPLTFNLDAGSGASFRSRSVHLLGWAALCKGTPEVSLSSSTQDSRTPSSSALGPDTGNPAETPWGQKVKQPKSEKLVKTVGEDRN